MQKCQISIIISDPPSGSPLREALAPQGDLGSKKGIKQIVLRIFFQEGSILCKNAKLAYLYLTPLQAAHLGGPSALGRPQIKKLKITKSSQNLI